MKKSTFVRSLLLCGLSMLLCISMLAGSTFAWFTDEVTSGNNQIMAGNLDVELYNDLVKNDAKKVSSTTPLFEEIELWEPGVVAFENLTVANEGTLALKYQLSVNIDNANGSKNLADVLKVAVVDGGINATDRNALISSIAADAWMSFASFVKSGKLDPVDGTTNTATYGIVIWWEPSDVDNDYNMNNGKGGALSIDLGVTLLATQVEAEEDSFGPDYDADAWMEGMQITNASDLQAAINAGETDIVLVEDIVLDESIVIPAAPTTYSLRNATPAVVIDLNGKNISVSEDKITTTYAITNLGNLVLMDSVGGGSVNSRGIYNGYIAETEEIIPSATLTVVNGVYNALGTNGGAAIFNYGSVTIESGTFTSVGGYTLNNREGASMIIEDATVTGGIYNLSTLVIEDGNISTNRGGYTHAIYSSGGSIEINGGNFSGNGNEVINANSDVAIINGGTFEKVGKTSYLLAGSKMVINAGTFNAYSENGVDPAAHPVRPDVTVNGGTFNYKHNNIATGYTAVANADGSYIVLPGESTSLVEDGLFVDGNIYYVTNANGLLALTTKSATYFSGKTIKLANDIDCTDVAMKKIYIWDPENPTTFDGCGYTIYNLDISTSSGSSDQGLINGTVNVKNLTVDGAWVEGYGYVGVISGKLYGNIENCHVKNAQVFAGYWQAGIIVGQFNGTSIKDCSVVDSEIYAPSAVATIAGIFTDNNATDIKFENCVVENCAINQTYSFGAAYDELFGAVLGCGNVDGKNYIFNDCVVENTTIKGEASTTICGNGSTVWIDGVPMVYSADQLAAVVKAGATNILLADGEYDLHGCGGKTLTITGSKNAVIKVANEGEAGSDYAFDGSTVTFNGVTFDTSANNGSYKGYARMVGIYNDCTFNGSYALNKDSEFTNCTFNISGDNYNIWTWGAPNATFTGCTLNSDGKAVLLYGGVNTALTLNDCTFNDNGGLSDKKAAVEIGNDYGASYTLIVNNTVVNGYEINDKGINTGSTLWGNKNSMGTDKLNVIVDGVDVY